MTTTAPTPRLKTDASLWKRIASGELNYVVLNYVVPSALDMTSELVDSNDCFALVQVTSFEESTYGALNEEERFIFDIINLNILEQTAPINVPLDTPVCVYRWDKIDLTPSERDLLFLQADVREIHLRMVNNPNDQRVVEDLSAIVNRLIEVTMQHVNEVMEYSHAG